MRNMFTTDQASSLQIVDCMRAILMAVLAFSFVPVLVFARDTAQAAGSVFPLLVITDHAAALADSVLP